MSKGKGCVLIIDDDAEIRESIQMLLVSEGLSVDTAENGEDGLLKIEENLYDFVLLDLMLPGKSGMDVYKDVRRVDPTLPVVIITAMGGVETAVTAIKEGCYDYVTKPWDNDKLLVIVGNAIKQRRLASENAHLRRALRERYGYSNIVGKSEKILQVLDLVSQVAPSRSTVLIQGESGTGKELIAKAIHLASDRKDKPFIALNCAALPETLLESELFGHEKGAFTGAVKSTRGLFTQAHGGTLFLDEIGDMPLSTQSKLLRVLQERQFYPVGSEIPTEVDVRVIAATNKDLEELVKKGTFRDDLFYRIHVIPIYLPPLREHKEDIVPLVEHFLKKCRQQMKKDVKGLTPEALRKLMLHDWPGNVRELENTVEYSVAMTQKEFVTEEYILQGKMSFSDGAQAVNDKPPVSDDALRPLKDARDAFERDYLVQVLSMTDGNVSQAAKLAGKYRADFYDLLKKHELKADDFKKTKSAASASI